VDVAAVLVGATAGVVVQLTAFCALVLAVLAGSRPATANTAYALRLAAPGAVGLSVACAVAARVVRRRCRARHLPERDLLERRLHRTSAAVGLGTGGLLLASGLVIALSWPTLPLYIAGVVVGSLAGAMARQRRTPR
jgi:hypothetical protein